MQNKPNCPKKKDLPTASELLTLLEQGTPCRVSGHSLTPDEDGIWVTNAYGADCGLWQDLTLQRVENFLSDMAMDKEYGSTP